ncbi:MAG: HEAT repeat domain-containing protein [Candidatus Thorarchaeota archaeon]
MGPDTLIDLEARKLQEMRSAVWSLEAATQERMYTSAQTLSMYEVNRTILPAIMTLLATDDIFVRKIVFRTAGKNVYGPYIPDFFSSISNLPPAEIAQVLQSIKESFKENGMPPVSDHKLWISSLEKLGREHHAGVFDLMASLGRAGTRWVSRFIRDDLQELNIGAIARIREFPEKTRHALTKLLCEEASKRKRDMLSYIAGIVDAKSVRFLNVFLSGGSWQERKEVATTVATIGITSASGLVRNLLNDPDWRVKQALAENINISKSKFSSLSRIMEILVADSHTRVKRAAGRTLLRMGLEPCTGSKFNIQRDRLMKRFREQLLKAAPLNKDINSSWLGVDVSGEDPIPIISPDDPSDAGRPEPVGIGDLASALSKKKPDTTSASGELDLRSALLKRMLETKEPTVAPIVIDRPEPIVDATSDASEIDLNLPPPARFLALMDNLSLTLGKALPVMVMKLKSSEIEMSPEEFDDVLGQLVKEGTIYMVDEDTVRRADILSE